MTDAFDEAAYQEWARGHSDPVQSPATDQGQMHIGGGAALIERACLSWPEFWSDDRQAEDYLVEPVFARGRGHSVVAPAKVGKSEFVMAASAALATGAPFLHHRASEPVPVLYLDYEMTKPDLDQRLDLLGYGPDTDLTYFRYVLHAGVIPPLDRADGGEALRAFVVKHGIRFVVFDSFARAVVGDEDDNDTVRDFYRCTGAPLKQVGCAWVRLDNTGHAEKGRARGASAKADVIDIAWTMSRREGGARLRCTESRVSWVPLTVELTRTADQVLTYNAALRSVPAGTAAAIDALDRAGVPDNVSNRQARAALNAAGETAGNEALTAAVRHRKQRVEVRA